MAASLRPPDDERPPGFGSWRGWYLLVLGTLALLVALFSLLSRGYP